MAGKNATIRCLKTEFNWVQDLADVYHNNLVKDADPEVMTWGLVNRDRLNFAIIVAYLLFVTFIGPTVMRNRKAFDLRWLMVPYNFFLVVLNLFIFVELARIRWFTGLEISCSPLKVTQDINSYRLAEITWWFYISKFIELSDTIFFVLRKKDRQLSHLHVIHHSTIPIVIFFLLRSEPGGYNTFFPLANSFVHVIMYTYYGISAIGDEVTIQLKFKKYITMTQLIQFVLVLSYMISRPWYGCSVSNRGFYINITIAGFFFALFCNFYWHEYLFNQAARKEVGISRYNAMKLSEKIKSK